MRTEVNMAFKTRYKPEEDEFIGEDGRIYCKGCNGARSIYIAEVNFEARCKCKCQEEEAKRKLEEEETERRKIRLAQMKEDSLLGVRYKDVTFDDIEVRSEEHATIIARLKLFCKNFHLNKGTGVFLFGPNGSGKTVLTACMVNSLIDKGIGCTFLNFTKIQQDLFGSDKKNLLRTLYTTPVLFIDDFATEVVKRNGEDKYVQEIIYDVVNTRYNNRLPIVFTSNYSFKGCIEDRGVSKKTIDRMYETTVQMELNLPSYRLKSKEESYF